MAAFESEIDQLSLMLAYIVSSEDIYHLDEHFIGSTKKKWVNSIVSVTDSVIPDMDISEPYTFDKSDKDRIYTRSEEYLKESIVSIVGKHIEYVTFTPENDIKWIGIKKRGFPPKGVSFWKKPHLYYEVHYRLVKQDGSGVYIKNPLGLDKSLKPIPCKVNGVPASGHQEKDMLVMAASIKEDAHRAESMLCTITDEKSIKFPLPVGDYKEFFKNRTYPKTSSGRRRPILHWVAEHIRKRKEYKKSLVSGHARGVKEILVDGYLVTVDIN